MLQNSKHTKMFLKRPNSTIYESGNLKSLRVLTLCLKNVIQFETEATLTFHYLSNKLSCPKFRVPALKSFFGFSVFQVLVLLLRRQLGDYKLWQKLEWGNKMKSSCSKRVRNETIRNGNFRLWGRNFLRSKKLINIGSQENKQ